MNSKTVFVVFIVSCVAVIQIAAQERCRPNRVDTLTLTADSTLIWSPPTDGLCTISYYLVDILNEIEMEYTVPVIGTTLSLSFLPVCENYQFIVTPISSDGVEGVERWHYAKMPLPVDANLSIVSFMASPHEVGVYLEWEVEEEWKHCADRFRLSIYDGESENPVDIYLYSNFVTISRLTPCATYQFGIRAIYNMAIEGPFLSNRYLTPAEVMSAPRLRSIRSGTTNVDLVWEMDPLPENRCPVSSLVLDAFPYFRTSYVVRDQNSRTYFPTNLVDLQPDTAYTLNVTVVNSAGDSESTLLVIQTLESG